MFISKGASGEVSETPASIHSQPKTWPSLGGKYDTDVSLSDDERQGMGERMK